MKWLPPGAAAKAIEQASIGAWGGALIWLGYTLLWVIVIGWLWWRITQRIVTGEGFLLGQVTAAPKVKDSKPAAQTRQPGGLSWNWIPADIRAIAVKDLKLRWRTPQSRIGLMYMYLMPAFFAAYPLFFDPSRDDTPLSISKAVIAGIICVYAIFIYWTNGQNMLGWELTGLPTLLLSPMPRQRLFLGKGLAQVLMNSLPILVLIIVAVYLHPGLLSLALLPTTTALGLACLSVVALFSVLFPYTINVESQSGQNPFSGKGGCITGLANASLMPMLIGLACLPIIAPFGVALWREWNWLALLGSLFALIYSSALFWFATRLAGQLALQREPEILVATRIKDKG
jgi:hypothetical protein